MVIGYGLWVIENVNPNLNANQNKNQENPI